MLNKREVIIISSDGSYNVYKSISNDPGDIKYYHSYYLKKYIDDNKINIGDIDINNITSTGPACEMLSKNGYSIIIIEGLFILIYLPEIITKEQSNFYYKNKMLFLGKSFYYSYIEDKKIIYSKFDDNEKNSFKVKTFYNYIKENLENQKRGEENEHRKTI